MKCVALAAVAVLIAACAGPPLPDVLGADPTDAAAPVPATRYAPVTAGTVDYRPVEPKPWLERNEQVAPDRSARP